MGYPTLLLLTLAMALSVHGHMQLSFPPPFRSTLNPYADQNTIDYSMTSPITAAQFPCKGYQQDLGTKAGTSTMSWAQGAAANITVIGGAVHGGGSCQISLSYDKGKSFTVIQSIEGGCPTTSGQSFNFMIPSDAPTGDSMLAWSWLNKIGNREYYMNCASISITAGTSSSPKVAFASRPELFVANLDNGCTSVEGTDVKFPNPGPDLTGSSSDSNSFTGTCQAVNGVGGGSAASSGPQSASDPSSSAGSSIASVAPSSMSAASSIGSIAPIPSSSTTSSTPSMVSVAVSSAAAATTVPTTGLTTTSDGQCSGAYTCKGSLHGGCCSKWGWCGSTSDYCGDGCQAGFGACGMFLNSTSSAQSSALSIPTVHSSTSDISVVSTTAVPSSSAGILSTSGFVGITSATSSSSPTASGFLTLTTAVSVTPVSSHTREMTSPTLISIIPLTPVTVTSLGKVTVTYAPIIASAR